MSSWLPPRDRADGTPWTLVYPKTPPASRSLRYQPNASGLIASASGLVAQPDTSAHAFDPDLRIVRAFRTDAPVQARAWPVPVHRLGLGPHAVVDVAAEGRDVVVEAFVRNDPQFHFATDRVRIDAAAMQELAFDHDIGRGRVDAQIVHGIEMQQHIPADIGRLEIGSSMLHLDLAADRAQTQVGAGVAGLDDHISTEALRFHILLEGIRLDLAADNFELLRALDIAGGDIGTDGRHLETTLARHLDEQLRAATAERGTGDENLDRHTIVVAIDGDVALPGGRMLRVHLNLRIVPGRHLDPARDIRDLDRPMGIGRHRALERLIARARKPPPHNNHQHHHHGAHIRSPCHWQQPRARPSARASRPGRRPRAAPATVHWLGHVQELSPALASISGSS